MHGRCEEGGGWKSGGECKVSDIEKAVVGLGLQVRVRVSPPKRERSDASSGEVIDKEEE